MIDWINHARAQHIITIEDPIEYVHFNRRCVVEQRELGLDTPTFGDALRACLRQDPNVLLVGEMRDLESIRIALSIAETGHLVFATLHTNDTTQAINRIVDVFPGEQQQQIRVQLAASLQAVIYQQLLPMREGGRVAAFEVLLANGAVKNLIRENKAAQLRNIIVTGRTEGCRPGVLAQRADRRGAGGVGGRGGGVPLPEGDPPPRCGRRPPVVHALDGWAVDLGQDRE